MVPKDKIMPLELLSSIKGARESEAVAGLFRVIQNAGEEDSAVDPSSAESPETVSLETLRSDEVRSCPEEIKEIIRANFPAEKNGYLVVPKVIED